MVCRNPFVNQVSFFGKDAKYSDSIFKRRNPFVNQVSFFAMTCGQSGCQPIQSQSLRKSGQFLSVRQINYREGISWVAIPS